MGMTFFIAYTPRLTGKLRLHSCQHLLADLQHLKTTIQIPVAIDFMKKLLDINRDSSPIWFEQKVGLIRFVLFSYFGKCNMVAHFQIVCKLNHRF